jgi:hypothetical protein
MPAARGGEEPVARVLDRRAPAWLYPEATSGFEIDVGGRLAVLDFLRRDRRTKVARDSRRFEDGVDYLPVRRRRETERPPLRKPLDSLERAGQER